ncbi:Uu.00g039040.m01.CDS01 [Anthostomella pinea]|uniref:Uu.00g039040.m01.CDS01 n=1 Tax=Anthostomella pinea TaxID=933095 RepID=A0AAI8V9Y6_9PEZI|nr:Uu.00g039040.m01.CDS01 [Anthostomella pinea]
MTASTIRQPDAQQVIGPLVPALTAASLSTQPAEAVLPLLSPILRQRVQLLSSASSNDPWIRLLCYDVASVPKLTEIAQSPRLEPHPVSGEVEIDWDYDAEIQYRRVDEETFQALVVLKDMELAFRLVYCTGDPMGDGWKVGEVSIPNKPSPFSSFGGVSTIAEAERQFNESEPKSAPAAPSNGPSITRSAPVIDEDDDEDDDDYWARYDATPGAKTPATKRSPPPQSTQPPDPAADADYYAQYDDVQPAMDNHDPDEESSLNVAPPLGLASSRPNNPARNGNPREEAELNETQGTWTLAEPPTSASTRSGDDPNLVHPHPRPGSSAGSSASVEKLEAAAAKQEQSDVGVKQHVSRSIKSLFLLSRASGIDREDFERMVKTELDMLGLMED